MTNASIVDLLTPPDTFLVGISEIFLGGASPLHVHGWGHDTYQRAENIAHLKWETKIGGDHDALVRLCDIVRDPLEVASWLTRFGWTPTYQQVHLFQPYVLMHVGMEVRDSDGWGSTYDKDFYRCYMKYPWVGVTKTASTLVLRPGSSCSEDLPRIVKG